MDTKSRKSHKLAKVIILLCVVLPALLLVALYPQTEKAMLEKRDYYLKLQEEEEKQAAEESAEPEWVIVDRFTNYAVEASYVLYAQILDETLPDVGDYWDVLYEYDWYSDYMVVHNNTSYIATYTPNADTEPYVKKNTEQFEPQVGKLVIQFNEEGKISEIQFEGDAVFSEGTLEEEAHASVNQYWQNAQYYAQEYSKDIEDVQAIPKNLRVEFALDEYSTFVEDFGDYYYEHDWYDYYMRPNSLWVEVGAYWIVIFLVLAVVFAAFLLPFIKPLNTGRERLFSLPLEIMIGIGVGTVFAGMGMCVVMAHSTMYNLEEIFQHTSMLEVLGYEIGISSLYFLLKIANFVGWALTFFLVYIVASAIRQFLAHPVQYLKNQTIVCAVLRWIKRKGSQLGGYITNIDLNDKLEKSVIKIVVANFIVVSVLCCLWFGGVLGTIIYSVLLYVLLKKYGLKLQKQYHSILRATEKMAAGDLKISLEEELGIFEPIGKSLEEVQEGFQKAVVEEAKSQNMKTELITNVSHDLKTPLTAIITYVNLLKKEDITEEERTSYIATLDQKSQRLKVLIEDLFEVSKAHSGNVKMNLMNVDVVSLLKQVRSEMSEQIENSNLYFRWNLPDEKTVLSLDGQRMYRVFENLINNILKYAMPYTRVYIDLAETDTKVHIRFRNVSASELEFEPERLTERFVRGDSSRNSEGSGLGLAIAKSFVELQKGEFKIEVDGDLFKVTISFDK